MHLFLDRFPENSGHFISYIIDPKKHKTKIGKLKLIRQTNTSSKAVHVRTSYSQLHRLSLGRLNLNRGSHNIISIMVQFGKKKIIL